MISGTREQRRAPGMANLASPCTPAAAPASVSSDQTCVVLCDWWFVKGGPDSSATRRLAIAGFTSKKCGARLFTSAPVVKRHDTFTLETDDGFTLIIEGPINVSRMQENGFPPEISSKFMIGFPCDWEHYAELSSFNCSTQEHSSPSSPDLIGKEVSSLLDSVAGGGKRASMQRYTVTREQESVASPEELNLKRTRSGRLVVPSLDPGTQRIIYNVEGFITGISGMQSPAPVNRGRKQGTPKKKRRYRL